MVSISVVALVLAVAVQVKGHGMVIQPPARATMWRYGFHTPKNWDDDGLNCGGYGEQWEINNGKCGQCGDDFRIERPRPNENGGEFGTGTIAQKYNKGDTMKVQVKLTTNHAGWFWFNLCPLTTKGELETDECFEQHPLLVNDQDIYYLPNHKSATFDMDVKLPEDVTCEQCVFQWTYHTANSWGTCDNGTEGMGCGPQEWFRTCSDIAIH